MARANKGGWDFVKVGEIYQYKEDHFLGMVKVIEDNSDGKTYKFKLAVQQANCADIGPDPFDIYHAKNPGGYWNGMVQIYEKPEYILLPPGTLWPVDYTQKGGDKNTNTLKKQ